MHLFEGDRRQARNADTPTWGYARGRAPVRRGSEGWTTSGKPEGGNSNRGGISKSTGVDVGFGASSRTSSSLALCDNVVQDWLLVRLAVVLPLLLP